MKAKIEELMAEAKKQQTAKIQAEARLEELQRRRNELVDRCKELGVSPETLAKTCEELEEELQKLLDKAEGLLWKQD